MFATMRVIAYDGRRGAAWFNGKGWESPIFGGLGDLARGVHILGRGYALDEWNIMSPNLSNVRDETIRSSCEGSKWVTIL